MIRIKRVRAGVPAPRRASTWASGLDLCAALDRYIDIPPGERRRIPIGWAVQIPFGFEGQVRPRSGISYRRGLVAVLGTIDADYRGEVDVLIVNVGSDTQRVEPGERVAQLVIAPVGVGDPLEVEELDPTVRGAGGWGSTGT